MSASLTEKMQVGISEKLEDAFEYVLKTKNEHYQKNPLDIPNAGQIDALIRSCANQNSAISGGASLIPGPWGMVAVIPELVLVIRNQIGLIYDIGAAHGKQELMTKELLLGVFISAMGTSAGSLLVLHGGKLMVRRASLQVLQRLIAVLGGRISQQALKSAISKWFPGVGAVAMAAWTNYLTRQIGKKAHEVLQHEIYNDPTTADIELIKPIEVATALVGEIEPSSQMLEFYKLQVLIGLAKIDGRISGEEEQFLTHAMDNPDLSSEQRLQLTEQLGAKSRPLEGVAALSASPDDAIALLSSMTALAKADDNFHITERLYIKQVGKLLGFSEDDIDEVMVAA